VHLFPRLSPAQEVVAIPALRVAGLVVWTRLLQQVLVGIEQAYERFGLLNVLNTLQAIVLNVGLAVVAWQGGGLLDLMLWQLLLGLTLLIVHLYACWSLLRPVGLRVLWNRQKGQEVGQYSVMAWLTALGGTFFVQGDRLIVGMVLGSTSVGIYAAITTLTSQINTVSALVVQPLMPVVSGHIAKDNSNRSPSLSLQSQVKQALQVNGFLALVCSRSHYLFCMLLCPRLRPKQM
jgi:O-antigen/teichoic acid export membrane protein